MPPLIRYVPTPDGVSLAYWTLGEGDPLIVMNGPPYSHVQFEWDLPAYRERLEYLARRGAEDLHPGQEPERQRR